MKDPHIIFIDFDGTLISNSFEIPTENIEAISSVRKKGHKVFLNTGRSYANCPPELLKYSDCFDGFICGNGSFILYNGEIVQNVYLPFDLFFSVFKYFFERQETCCVFQSSDVIFKTGRNADKFCKEGILITDIDEITEKFSDIKINVFCAEGQMKSDFYDMFSDKLQVYQCRTYADCVTKGYSKAVGVKKMVEILSIPIENTVAIGDSENDLPMFECCGTAVAMGNAPDAVKEKADYVSARNNEFGVAKALRHLFM